MLVHEVKRKYQSFIRCSFLVQFLFGSIFVPLIYGTISLLFLCWDWFGVYVRAAGALWWVLNVVCWCLRSIVGLLGTDHACAYYCQYMTLHLLFYGVVPSRECFHVAGFYGSWDYSVSFLWLILFR